MTDAERCYAAALRIIGYRFNSEAELRRKLQAKKFEKTVIESTLARLQKEKLVDDERFLRAACEHRARTLVRRHGADYLDTHEGRMKLAAYLINHGYERSLVFDAVREISANKAALVE